MCSLVAKRLYFSKWIFLEKDCPSIIQIYMISLKIAKVFLDYAPHFYVLLMLFVNGLVAYMTCISRHPDVGLNSVARYGPNALCFVLSALPCIIR